MVPDMASVVRPATADQRRLGNQYTQFTRKFSLGNGPSNWVSEYMITKESGKMLGTLVALAVARMVNLETFVWDMPTGVLRDVWLALSSLERRNAKRECRLERVWVRWHDNAEPIHDSDLSDPSGVPPPNSPPPFPPGSTMTPIGLMVPLGNNVPNAGDNNILPSIQNQSRMRVEYPTLSVLPPLKSLSVLDIDELAYLDEMSVVIERSQHSLRELRVGISKKAHWRPFVLAWDGPNFEQVDLGTTNPSESNIGKKRLGGVLGIILGRVYSIRKRQQTQSQSRTDNGVDGHSDHTVGQPISNAVSNPQAISEIVVENPPPGYEAISQDDGNIEVRGDYPHPSVVDSTLGEVHKVPLIAEVVHPKAMQSYTTDGISLPFGEGGNTTCSTPTVPPTAASQSLDDAAAPTEPKEGAGTCPKGEAQETQRTALDGKLRLQVLELERVPLSIVVLQKAFDWSVLTSLTILDCAQHENLWRMLRRQFQPQLTPSSSLATSKLLRNSINQSSSTRSKLLSDVPMDYRLNIKKIHTDAPSSALISFLKETLAPNTLEVLFLQDRRRTPSPHVSIDAIYKGALRRHRSSLTKVMLDSADKIPKTPNNVGLSPRWRTWMANRELLNFFTSGKMSNLKELGIAIDYKDWVGAMPAFCENQR